MAEKKTLMDPTKTTVASVMPKLARTQLQGTPPSTRTMASSGRLVATSSRTRSRRLTSLLITTWVPLSGVVIRTSRVRPYTSSLIAVLIITTATNWAPRN